MQEMRPVGSGFDALDEAVADRSSAVVTAAVDGHGGTQAVSLRVRFSSLEGLLAKARGRDDVPTAEAGPAGAAAKEAAAQADPYETPVRIWDLSPQGASVIAPVSQGLLSAPSTERLWVFISYNGFEHRLAARVRHTEKLSSSSLRLGL